MPDLEGAGIEYPTMVFQGPQSLTRATTHEVAHSWFYALVGNNQARDPWLDEGLTSWAQARGDRILQWFRRVPVPPSVRGATGRPMPFWERHPDAYFAGVYAQGVRALASLGPPRLVDCALRHYVRRNAYGIARTHDLLDSLERVFPDAPRRLEAFGIDSGGER
jgi:aminopeptidase N